MGSAARGTARPMLIAPPGLSTVQGKPVVYQKRYMGIMKPSPDYGKRGIEMEKEYSQGIINECLTEEKRKQIEKYQKMLANKGCIERNEILGDKNMPGMVAGWDNVEEDKPTSLTIQLEPNSSKLKEIALNGRACYIKGYYSQAFNDVGAKLEMPDENTIKIIWH
jgi:hypothetical protein